MFIQSTCFLYVQKFQFPGITFRKSKKSGFAVGAGAIKNYMQGIGVDGAFQRQGVGRVLVTKTERVVYFCKDLS